MNNLVLAQKIIQKKLLGKELNKKEIFYVINLISKKKLSNILIAYFTAAFFQGGFTNREIFYLIKAMVETGNQLNFEGIIADKHSTGGVPGTRTSPIVVSIVAAAGFKIPKISSRAITTPAGTADVMEVLAPVDLSLNKVKEIVEKIGGCLVWNGQMAIAPADDIIIKVEKEIMFESFDKIIISILAKKVAVGSKCLILDIPYGPNLKIKKRNEANFVLKEFVRLGKKFNIEIIGSLNLAYQPAGNGVGPALEARDVLLVLEQRQNRPLALEEKSLRLAGELISLCYNKLGKKMDGYILAKDILKSGKALKKFKEIIYGQGGDPMVESSKIKLSAIKEEIKSYQQGQIKKINLYYLSSIARALGAPKDKNCGVYLYKKIGDEVNTNEPLMVFYAKDEEYLQQAKEMLKNFSIYEIK